MPLFFYKKKAFSRTFSDTALFKSTLYVLGATLAVNVFFIVLITNNQAEWSSNRYNSEISKSVIYSFFAAFRNNQMKYNEFYTSIKNEDAFAIVKSKLQENNSEFLKKGFTIHRKYQTL